MLEKRPEKPMGIPELGQATRWRDDAIIPDDYSDVAALVRLARKARGRLVEFNWVFQPEQLLRLRRAVFEWGVLVAGRYRVFDALVLASINSALEDVRTIETLPVPKGAAALNAVVSYRRDGDAIVLSGHAPFDVIVFYGMAGVGISAAVTLNLGPAVSRSLADTVAMLGWDLVALNERRLRPVLNVLYGNAPNCGIGPANVAQGPPLDVALDFDGPFSALDDTSLRCLFADESSRRAGIYLWTVLVDGRELPWYVGQTRRSFRQRMGEHVAGFLSGQYPFYDVAALRRGRNERAARAVLGQWPEIVPQVLKNYAALAENVEALVRLLRIHVAPVQPDRYVLDRVEGAIGRFLKERTSDQQVREFFFPGMRVPAAIPFDRQVRIAISTEAPVAGLPGEIQE